MNSNKNKLKFLISYNFPLFPNTLHLWTTYLVEIEFFLLKVL